MKIVAILSSPTSFGQGQEMDRIRSVVEAGSAILHFEVEKHKDVREALKRFSQMAVEAIVILGGRALTLATFEILLEDKVFGQGVPPLVILPAGDNNILAESFGAHSSSPHRELQAFLAKRDAGRLMDNLISLPLIRVEGVRVVEKLYGLFFCAGEIVCDKAVFNSSYTPYRILRRIRDGLAVFRTLRKAYFNAWKGRRAGQMIRINRNQRGAVMGHYFMVVISTMDRLFLGARFPDVRKAGSAHFLSVENTTDALKATAPQLIRRDYHMSGQPGHVVTDIKHARIVLEQPFVMDGSYFEAQDGGEIHISVVEELSFIRLD